MVRLEVVCPSHPDEVLITFEWDDDGLWIADPPWPEASCTALYELLDADGRLREVGAAGMTNTNLPPGLTRQRIRLRCPRPTCRLDEELTSTRLKRFLTTEMTRAEWAGIPLSRISASELRAGIVEYRT